MLALPPAKGGRQCPVRAGDYHDHGLNLEAAGKKGFYLASTVGQWRLHDDAWLSPALAATRSVLTGGLLIAAGIYQLTPLKSSCLGRCRTPPGFLLGEWREGTSGALMMGIRHGAFCAGCC